MALQQLGSVARALLFKGPSVRQAAVPAALRNFGGAAHDEGPPAQTPTVFDKVVQLSVVDLEGRRHAVRGLVGQTLAEALVEAGFPDTYFFPNMGFYTQHINDAHVFIPKDYWHLVPCYDSKSEEAGAIKRMFRDIVQDFAKDASFFASYIKLSKEMDNMTVGMGPIKPWILHTHRAFGGVHDWNVSQFSKPTNEIWG